ncbi:MAG: type II toxin-antitoxin system RelE/ParE family toxin [Bryobacterales bacterium]|nr:type II toxin-antitoxin system RelE/ParE family toxin [Bryobacterales bacterium]
MSGIPVRFHPDAVEEAEAAVDWYAKRSRRVANRFLLELEGALGAICEAPGRWPFFDGPARRILFRRFPYVLIYRACEDRIEVLAVAHGRRRPGYWKNRTD